MKYCNSNSDIPRESHLAALVFSTYTIPGDERSRTYPGHGYPESTGTTITYIAFASEAECNKWISEQESRTYRSENYQIITSKPLSVRKSVSVELT